MSEITRELSELAGGWNLVISTFVTPSNSNYSQILKANPLRWGLLIANSNPTSASVMIAPYGGGGTTFGIVLNPTTAPTIYFNYRDNPALVQAPWFANGLNNNGTLIMLEEVAQQ